MFLRCGDGSIEVLCKETNTKDGPLKTMYLALFKMYKINALVREKLEGLKGCKV